MKNLKSNKAITLIALIITIVLIMILAVVTIGAVNEGGLFAHANNATTKYSTEADLENTKIAGYISEMEKWDKGSSALLEEDVVGSLVYALFFEEDDEAFDKIIEAGITEDMLDHPYYYMEGRIDDYFYQYFKFSENGDEMLVRGEDDENMSFVSHNETEIYNVVYAAIELESELKDAFENKNITIDQLISILNNNQLQDYVTTQINSVEDQRKKNNVEFYVTINNIKFEFASEDYTNYYIDRVEIYG